MNTLTIPRTFIGKDDLVVLPRLEYEALLQMNKLEEFDPTAIQKKALMSAEANFRKGKTLSYYELVKKLGFENC